MSLEKVLLYFLPGRVCAMAFFRQVGSGKGTPLCITSEGTIEIAIYVSAFLLELCCAQLTQPHCGRQNNGPKDIHELIPGNDNMLSYLAR